MTVSVVVAAYDEAAHIGRLLESISRQTVAPLDVIVVDDGSTDATFDIAQASGARVLRTPHRGPAHARNQGARLAGGDIIVFVDGDMCLDSSFVERLIAPMVEAGAVGSFTKEIFVGNVDSEWSRAYAAIRRLSYPRLLPADFPDVWANFRAIRRDAFLSVGGYDDVGYGEDMTLAAKLGVSAVAAPGARCWHFNPESVREIFDNARWIGRGHDMREVAHPWRDNSPLRSLRRGAREALRRRHFAPLVARLTYHTGVLLGLSERHLGRHHSK